MERSDLYGKELSAIEFLAALDGQMGKNGDLLKHRLSLVKHGWRQYRLISTALDALVRDMYDTLTYGSLKRIRDMQQMGEVVIRLKSISQAHGYMQISEESLARISTSAMRGECALCILEGNEVKSCALRKALWEIAPPDELPSFGCPYRSCAMEGLKA